MLGKLGHIFWVLLMLFAGFHGWGYWFPVVGAVTVSYLNRHWHADNGCTERRAIVLGTIFALTATLPLYLLGTWIEQMP